MYLKCRDGSADQARARLEPILLSLNDSAQLDNFYVLSLWLKSKAKAVTDLSFLAQLSSRKSRFEPFWLGLV